MDARRQELLTKALITALTHAWGALDALADAQALFSPDDGRSRNPTMRRWYYAVKEGGERVDQVIGLCNETLENMRGITESRPPG